MSLRSPMINDLDLLNVFILEVILVSLAIFTFLWLWIILTYTPRKRGRHTYD